MPNQAKQKLQKIQRWQRVEKQKTLKLKTQVFQLKQPHKKPGFPLTIGRIEHGTLEHPSARRAPYYPICYTCSWHSPPLLVSVATSCLNREGLEPKGYGALAPLAVCFAVFSMVRRKSGWGICVLPFVLVFRCLVSYDLSYFMRPPVSMLKFLDDSFFSCKDRALSVIGRTRGKKRGQGSKCGMNMRSTSPKNV